MKKSQYRHNALKKLKSIKKDRKVMIENQIMKHLLMTTYWKTAQIIGISISLDYEWNTEPIIRAAWHDGKTVAIPKTFPKNHELKFYEFYSYDTLENVYHELLEPNPDQARLIKKSMIDLLIVPGLLFDASGYRIGFGGGYYDRFLDNFPNETVSLTGHDLLVDQLPVDSFDIPVHHLLTEHGTVK